VFLPKVHHQAETLYVPIEFNALHVEGLAFFLFLVLFCNHTGSAQITSGTHTGGGAEIRKPRSAWLKGTPAMDLGRMNVVLKWICMLGEGVGIEIYCSIVMSFTWCLILLCVWSVCCRFVSCVLSVCCLFVLYSGCGKLLCICI